MVMSNFRPVKMHQNLHGNSGKSDLQGERVAQ